MPVNRLFGGAFPGDKPMRNTNCIPTILTVRRPDAMQLPSWREWIATGGRKAAGDLLRLVEMLGRWHDRARQRSALAMLDDTVLKDIGLSRVDVWLECSKPFWRA